MIPHTFNPRTALRVTRIIFFGQVTGSLFFFSVSAFLTKAASYFKADLSDPLVIVNIILICVAIPVGFFLSAKKFKNVKQEGTLKDKYPVYQTGFIMRLGFCNGAGLFSLVCFLISSNFFFLIFFSIALLVLIFNYPTPDRIGESICLTQAEIESFLR
jgi:hypothetical protein